MIKDTIAEIANLLSTNKNINLIKKDLGQNHNFSARINYANKKIREVWMNMVKTTYKSTENMIKKLQPLKGKTKLKLSKNIGNYYDKMNIRMNEGPFARNAQGMSKIYLEVFLLMKFLQPKPQVKNMNNIYYGLYYTVNKNRDEKGIVDNQYKNDYINFNDIFPNHYIRIKKDNVILR